MEKKEFCRSRVYVSSDTRDPERESLWAKRRRARGQRTDTGAEVESRRDHTGRREATRLLFCPVGHARAWWVALWISLRSGLTKTRA